MKVFVSWSGAYSKAMAEILHKFLPILIQDLQVFFSHKNLESGERWGIKLAHELENAEFGIICLTPDNHHNDWLLFEAGALTKHLEGRACCLYFGGLQTKDIKGPLLQFQNQIFDEAGMRVLLRHLNDRLKKPLANIDIIFDKWWPDIEAAYRSVSVHPPASPERDERDVLDEILLTVRGIEKNLESGLQKAVVAKKRRVSISPLATEDYGPEDQE